MLNLNIYIYVFRVANTSKWLHIYTQLWLTFPLSRRRGGENLVARQAIYNQFTQFPRHFRDACSMPGPKRAFREVTWISLYWLLSAFTPVHSIPPRISPSDLCHWVPLSQLNNVPCQQNSYYHILVPTTGSTFCWPPLEID